MFMINIYLLIMFELLIIIIDNKIFIKKKINVKSKK